MNCSKADYYFMKYMDNCLSNEEAENLSKHLEACEKCRTDFQVYDSLVKEFSACELIEAPEDLEIIVMEKISQLEPTHSKADKLSNTLLTVFMAAMGVVLAAGIILFFNRGAVLEIMSEYPQLDFYVSLLSPVDRFVSDLSVNIGGVFVNMANAAAVFLNSIKYLILVAALSLFGIQYVLYKKEKDKVEE